MSAEEREHQKKEAFQKQLRGLLGRFEEGALTANSLMERIVGLESEENISDRRLLLEEIFDRIDPEHDNRRWLELLAQLDPAICAPLEKTLAKNRERVAALKERARQAMRERLRNEHAIEGSAVVCNPDADPAYRERLATLHKEAKNSTDRILSTPGD
jgi:hypothetical protein